MDRLSLGVRRRTIGGGGSSTTLGVPRKQGGTRSHRHTSDTTSEAIDKSEVRYENTYKLPPSDSDRFDTHRVKQVINTVLENRFQDAVYDRESSVSLTKELSGEIHRRVKDFKWKRYKLVCHVTIGQHTGQGIEVASRCVWDTTLDNFCCVKYINKNLFVIAQCFGIYYE